MTTLADPTFPARAAGHDRLRPVRIWLWAIALLILAMVLVGGATRLTESGLSITEWKPIAGALPPIGEEAWREAFEKYKQIPQYAQLFPNMDLAAFKTIFYWEWSHRLLGRAIGLAFALPLALFWLQGRLDRRLKVQLSAILALGALQGAVGWWMVVSGLVGRVEVAQERLAIHLLLASLTLAAVVYVATGLAPPRRREQIPRRQAMAAAVLVAGILAQIGLGGLVAGLRAGLTYNTWPLMDGHFIPPAEHLWRLAPRWANLLDNVTTVQLQHRLGAYCLLAFALWHAWDARQIQPASGAARRAGALFLLLAAQAAAGIVTLLLVVPIGWALAHQGLAMAALAMAAVHLRRAREASRGGGR